MCAIIRPFLSPWFHDAEYLKFNFRSQVSGAGEINIQSHRFELWRQPPQFSNHFSDARSQRGCRSVSLYRRKALSCSAQIKQMSVFFYVKRLSQSPSGAKLLDPPASRCIVRKSHPRLIGTSQSEDLKAIRLLSSPVAHGRLRYFQWHIGFLASFQQSRSARLLVFNSLCVCLDSSRTHYGLFTIW